MLGCLRFDVEDMESTLIGEVFDNFYEAVGLRVAVPASDGAIFLLLFLSPVAIGSRVDS